MPGPSFRERVREAAAAQHINQPGEGVGAALSNLWNNTRNPAWWNQVGGPALLKDMQTLPERAGSILMQPVNALDRFGRTLTGQEGGYGLEYDPSMGRVAPSQQLFDDANLLGGLAQMNPAVPANAFGMGMKLYHGSPSPNIERLMPSDRGPLGPGVYATPTENLAQRYANRDGDGYLYDLEAPDEIFHGTRNPEWDGDVNPFQVWRDQKSAVMAVAPDNKRAEIEKLFDKLSYDDGYPFFARLSNLMGGDTEAQALLRKAGFKGISGFVDGKEVLMFDPVNVTRKREAHDPLQIVGVPANRAAPRLET